MGFRNVYRLPDRLYWKCRTPCNQYLISIPRYMLLICSVQFRFQENNRKTSSTAAHRTFSFPTWQDGLVLWMMRWNVIRIFFPIPTIILFFNFPSAAASTPSGTKIHFHSWSYLKTVKRKKEGKDDEESFLLSLRLTFLRRSFLLLWFHVSSVIAWWLVTLSHFMTWDFSSKSYETFTVVEQKMSKNIISFTRHEGCAAPFPHGSWIHKTWILFALLSLFLIEFNYFFPFFFPTGLFPYIFRDDASVVLFVPWGIRVGF